MALPLLSRLARHSPSVILSLACFGASAACSKGGKVATVYSLQSTFESQAERVVVVSFDGMRPDAMEKAETPHLHSMMAAGAHTAKAQAVFPSITLVNHTSMISGVGPAKHGVDWNTYAPEKGAIAVPTMFDLAKAKGLVTAMIAGKEKFRHLDRPGTIDHLRINEGDAASVAADAIAILKESRPQLMFVHFRHADSEGHDHGWMSDEQIEAIKEEDQALGMLLNALSALDMLDTTAVIATADHGGSEKTHGTTDPIHMTIPWIAVGAEIPVRGALTQSITTYDTAATAAEILGLDIPATWDGANVFRKP